MRDLIMPLGTGGNLTSDVHPGALAIEHGAELYSYCDFGRFSRLRWRAGAMKETSHSVRRPANSAIRIKCGLHPALEAAEAIEEALLTNSR